MLISTAVHLAANLALGLMTSRSESWHLEISVDRRPAIPAKVKPGFAAGYVSGYADGRTRDMADGLAPS